MWWALAAGLTGCGGEAVGIILDFGDPVVEARARGLVTQVLTGACEPLWDVSAGEVTGLGSVRGVRSNSYPLRPEDVLPKDETSADIVHVAVRDRDGLSFARGCAPLPTIANTPLSLSGLPECVVDAPALDVAVVFDGSDAMAVADPTFGNVAASFRQSFIEAADFPPGSRFMLVGHGLETNVVFGNSAVATELADGVDTLAGSYQGVPDLYTGITLAARRLRDRASCARRPVLVAVAAGSTPEVTSRAVAADAAFALYASQLSRTDDIFAFGVALTMEALEDLSRAIPEDVGEVQGARSSGTLQAALQQASFLIRQRVAGP